MKTALAIGLLVLPALLILPATLSASRAPLDERVPALRIGDPAPKLEWVKRVRGTPIREFEPGKVYVIDFFGTHRSGDHRWSLPFVLAVSERFPEHVIAIEISACRDCEDEGPARKFVESLGSQLVDHVVSDVPSWRTSRDYITDTLTFLDFPVTFVVDGDGRLAWIGLANDGLSECIESVLAGTWDLEAARERHEAEVRKRFAWAQGAPGASPPQQARELRVLMKAAEEWASASDGTPQVDRSNEALAWAHQAVTLDNRWDPEPLRVLALVHARRLEWAQAVAVQGEALDRAPSFEARELKRTLGTYRRALARSEK